MKDKKTEEYEIILKMMKEEYNSALLWYEIYREFLIKEKRKEGKLKKLTGSIAAKFSDIYKMMEKKRVEKEKKVKVSKKKAPEKEQKKARKIEEKEQKRARRIRERELELKQKEQDKINRSRGRRLKKRQRKIERKKKVIRFLHTTGLYHTPREIEEKEQEIRQDKAKRIREKEQEKAKKIRGRELEQKHKEQERREKECLTRHGKSRII